MKSPGLGRVLRAFAAAVFMISATGFAQSESPNNGQSVAKPPAGNPPAAGFASKGARLTLSKPVFTSELIQDIKGRKVITGDQPAGAFGLGLGYVYLPIRKIGWTGDFSAVSFSYNQSTDVQYMLRIAGNVAAALDDSLYFKSGVNLSQTLGARVVNGIATQTRPGLGFQAGLGYQFSPASGAELSYAWMAQPHNAGGELLAQGVEFGISGNF